MTARTSIDFRFVQVHSPTLGHHGVLFRSRAEPLRLGVSSRLRTPADDVQDASVEIRMHADQAKPEVTDFFAAGDTPSGLASSSRLRSRSSRLLAYAREAVCSMWRPGTGTQRLPPPDVARS